MKHAVAFIILFCTSIVAFGGNEPSNPLDRELPDIWLYKSFDDAVRQIEQTTGWKVSCSKEISEFMESLGLYGPYAFLQARARANPTVKAFLEDIRQNLALSWAFDPATNIVTLDFAWKASSYPREYGDGPLEQRQAAHFLYRPGDGNDVKTNTQWPIVFNALISSPPNIERAWRVRQKSEFQGIFPLQETSKVGGDPILTKPVITTSLKRVIFVLISQPICMMPGNGSVSYYWFNYDDSTLLGAGLMNTGHNCELTNVTIDNEHLGTDKPTEITMDSGGLIARFVLTDNGLKLKHLADKNGENVNGNGIGDDLIAPLHTSDDFSAQYSFLKINFDGIAPEVDDASGAVIGFKANIAINYPSNKRLVSWNQRDGCIVTFEDENGDRKKLEFHFEQLPVPDVLIHKYKPTAGYRIWPKEMIDWEKETEAKQ